MLSHTNELESISNIVLKGSPSPASKYTADQKADAGSSAMCDEQPSCLMERKHVLFCVPGVISGSGHGRGEVLSFLK